MLRPQAVKKETQDIIKGIDIMLALDVSGSMQADDLQPNRLEAAKYVCKSFLMGLNNDRVGMVVFAGKSFTQCPLTNDYEIVNSFIDQVGLDTVKVDGTAMGDGIVNCVNRLENSGGSKVIILATDGINNQGIPPDEAAKIAAYKGIKIYTIGIGKKGGAQAFVRLPNGTKQPAVDQFGRYVKWEEPDEAVLTRVADITGGKYFRATDNRALANIYATIGRLEKQDIKVKNYEHKEDKFFIFLLIGVSLLVVAVALEAWKYIRIIR
jgi:Ca-activated chloride channel family protein